MNFLEKIRFNRKIRRLSGEMAKVLTAEDAMETANTINSALLRLPDHLKEGLIDKLLTVTEGALKDVDSIHK